MKLDLRAFKDGIQYDLEYCGGYVYFIRYPDQKTDEYESVPLEEVIAASIDNHLPWTIDMYTGIEDDNGVKIYENDLISWSNVCPISQVVFRDGMFGFFQTGFNGMFVELYGRNCIVVGNIYTKYKRTSSSTPTPSF